MCHPSVQIKPMISPAWPLATTKPVLSTHRYLGNIKHYDPQMLHMTRRRGRWAYSHHSFLKGGGSNSGTQFGVYCNRQKFCNKLVLLITLHRLKILPRCKIQICSLEYTLPDGIRVHTICAKIWSVRGISEWNAIFTSVNYFFRQKLNED